MGLCSYFRRFVKKIADITRPLTGLLKKGASFWGPHQERPFSTLIERLTSSPILSYFDPSAPTVVHPDASSYGVGAVLAQHQQGHDRVIAYASHILSTP